MLNHENIHKKKNTNSGPINVIINVNAATVPKRILKVKVRQYLIYRVFR
jgi:hypothetical protein